MNIEIKVIDLSALLNEEAWKICFGNFHIEKGPTVIIVDLKKARQNIRRLLKTSSFSQSLFDCVAVSPEKIVEDIEKRFLKRDIGFEEYRRLIGSVHKETQENIDEELKKLVEEERMGKYNEN